MDDLEKTLLEQFSADSQSKEIDRQRRIAEVLIAQGLKQPQGQMVSGYYIAPSWTQQLAPLVSTAFGASMSKDLDKKEIELAKALRAAKAKTEESIIDKMTGTPDQVTEMAGPYGMSGSGQDIPMPVAYKEGRAPDLAGALREINTNRFGAGKDMKAAILKQMMPDPTEQQRNYRFAQQQGYKGSFNDYKNQMTDSQAAQLKIDLERLKFERNRLNNENARLMFDTGIGGGGGGAGFMPTGGPFNPMINSAMPGQPGMPQGGVMPNGMPQMPAFRTKAEQDVWVAEQKARGELRAKAVDALPTALATAKQGIAAIEGMIGDTTVDAKGNIIKGKRDVHPGFYGAVGVSGPMTGFGASGFLWGTDVTDFKKRFNQIEGKSFLAAIDSLRGTGQITEIEGAKATAAINRMSLAQSEKEFIIAANELKEIMRNGYENAQTKAGVRPMGNSSLGGQAPALRYDLNTKTWVETNANR